MRNFALDSAFFDNKRIVEIGCGPQGFSANLMATGLSAPAQVVTFDPLMWRYRDFPTFSMFQGAITVSAKGEEVPLASHQYDIIVCQNVIDHVDNPHLVVGEMERLLCKGGFALVSVHAIPHILKPLDPFICRFDVNHPYHFDRNDVLNLFGNFSLVRYSEIILYKDNPGLRYRLFEPKVAIAAFLMSTLYLVLQKK